MFALELLDTSGGFECFRLEPSESVDDCTARFVSATHEMWTRCLDIRVGSSTNGLIEIVDSSLAHLSAVSATPRAAISIGVLADEFAGITVTCRELATHSLHDRREVVFEFVDIEDNSVVDANFEDAVLAGDEFDAVHRFATRL
jgi:hypothetical protein